MYLAGLVWEVTEMGPTWPSGEAQGAPHTPPTNFSIPLTGTLASSRYSFYF